MFLVLSNFTFGQVPAFDRLEQLFFQKHYKIVHRKSDRLLNKPEYDYSKMPLYYRSISRLELASNSIWLKRNEAEFEQAIIDLLEIKKSSNFEYIEEWIIVYDGNRIETNPSRFI